MATQQSLYRALTAVTFKASGGTALWTPTSIAAGAGRISAVWDRGATPLPVLYRWRMQTRWVATVAANDALRIYIIQAAATATPGLTDGGLTFGDAGVAAETILRAQGTCIGSVIAGVAADKNESMSGLVELWDEFIGVACWNASATKALSATAADHILTLTPEVPDLQAAA